MKIFELKSIQYDNWRLPNEEELRKELGLKQQKPYAKELGLDGKINCWDSWQNITKAVSKGKIVRLPYDKYHTIERLSPGSSLQSMHDISLNYRSGPRDPFRIAKGFENDDSIPMAMVMEVEGRLILTAGNTRLSSAKICNINPPPKILIIPGKVKGVVYESIKYKNPNLTYLTKQKSIAWDLDNTLINSEASPILQQFILDNPKIKHYIVTARTGLLFDNMFKELSKYSIGLTEDNFLGVYGPDFEAYNVYRKVRKYREKGKFDGPLLPEEKYAINFKGKTCKELSISVLVDDSHHLHDAGCKKYGIKIIDPLDCI